MNKMFVLTAALLMSGFASMAHAYKVTINNQSAQRLGYLIRAGKDNTGTIDKGSKTDVTLTNAQGVGVQFWIIAGNQELDKVLKSGQPSNGNSSTNPAPATATTFTVTGSRDKGLTITKQ
jgi:hypothetical protein